MKEDDKVHTIRLYEINSPLLTSDFYIVSSTSCLRVKKDFCHLGDEYRKENVKNSGICVVSTPGVCSRMSVHGRV